MDKPRDVGIHVLITGSSGGVGRALAMAYAKPGVHLSLLGRQVHLLEEVAFEARRKGALVDLYSLDLRKTEALITQIESIDTAHPIDLIIANAGIAFYLDETLPLESFEEIQQTIEVNLLAAIATVTPLIPRMQQRQRGHIAFVSSVAAYYGLEICPSYCASKAGLKAYAEALHTLLKKDKIQVSVICPGFIESAMSVKYHHQKHGLLLAEAAAKKIKQGLQRNKANITFPFFLGLGMRILSILPTAMSEFFLGVFL